MKPRNPKFAINVYIDQELLIDDLNLLFVHGPRCKANANSRVSGLLPVMVNMDEINIMKWGWVIRKGQKQAVLGHVKEEYLQQRQFRDRRCVVVAKGITFWEEKSYEVDADADKTSKETRYYTEAFYVEPSEKYLYWPGIWTVTNKEDKKECRCAFITQDSLFDKRFSKQLDYCPVFIPRKSIAAWLKGDMTVTQATNETEFVQLNRPFMKLGDAVCLSVSFCFFFAHLVVHGLL